MSALTIERLIGNTNFNSNGLHHLNHQHEDTHREGEGGSERMTMSTDSSDNASESSVTSRESHAVSHEREEHELHQHQHLHQRHFSLTSHQNSKQTPSRYSKIHLLLSNDNSDEEEGPDDSRFTPDEENGNGNGNNNDERFLNSNGLKRRHVDSRLKISSDSYPIENESENESETIIDVEEIEKRIKKESESNNNNNNTGVKRTVGISVDIGDKPASGDGDNGIEFRTSAPGSLCTQVQIQNFSTESSSSRIIDILVDRRGREDNKSEYNQTHNGMDSSDDQKRINLIGRAPRPPSRPSSSASETSLSSCFISSPKIKSIQPQHPPSHRFSISDILKPDFGLNAIQRIHERLQQGKPATIRNNRNKQHQHYSRSSNVKSSENAEIEKDRTRSDSGSGSGSGNGERKDENNADGGETMIKNHSEDSNSSCNSGRREVVDESKVNPSVPKGPLLWPAWVYCTRYSDRPSSGPRSRRIRKPEDGQEQQPEEKRPRTAFTAEQLGRLKNEFEENRYLTEKRRQDLARDLKLHENQIKIWFQNKRAKLKKSNGQRGGLALQLMAQGLYNHSTVPIDEDEDYII